MNRAKDKGTFAERVLAAYLQEHGWPYAERRALAGAEDKGDITGTPGIAWEVKYAGNGLRMSKWADELIAETEYARAKHGVLVVKPQGLGAKSVASWFALMIANDFDVLAWRAVEASQGTAVIRSKPVTPYSASRLGDQLVQWCASVAEWEAPVLTLRPRGTMEQPGFWWRVTTVRHIVNLLRVAGFGDPLLPLPQGGSDEALAEH